VTSSCFRMVIGSWGIIPSIVEVDPEGRLMGEESDRVSGLGFCLGFLPWLNR
jgi:hypothetical protein